MNDTFHGRFTVAFLSCTVPMEVSTKCGVLARVLSFQKYSTSLL